MHHPFTLFLLSVAGRKFTHANVNDLSGRLDQGFLVMTVPLHALIELTIRHAVDMIPRLDGVVVVKEIRRDIIGVIHHAIRVHSIKMVLKIGQKQRAHASVSTIISSVFWILKNRTLTAK